MTIHGEIDTYVREYERGRLSRRELVLRLTALAGLGASAGLGAAVPIQETRPSAPTFKTTELNHIALRVTDLERSRAFYERHLGLELMSQSARSVFLRCGPHFVAMFAGRDRPGLDHYCFTIPKYEPGRVVEILKGAGLEPERHDDRVYFKDPDGIELQLAAPRRRDG